MPENIPLSEAIENFIRQEIDTIPHLEALLLAWKNPQRQWTVEEMSAELYVDAGRARNVLQDLVRRNLLAVTTEPERYSYRSIFSERDELIAAVESAYRKQLIQISRMVHAKAAPSVRQFAEAFRINKNRE